MCAQQFRVGVHAHTYSLLGNNAFKFAVGENYRRAITPKRIKESSWQTSDEGRQLVGQRVGIPPAIVPRSSFPPIDPLCSSERIPPPKKN